MDMNILFSCSLRFTLLRRFAFDTAKDVIGDGVIPRETQLVLTTLQVSFLLDRDVRSGIELATEARHATNISARLNTIILDPVLN